MIRINLLGVERQKARPAFALDQSARITLACSAMLLVTALGIGWWYWSLTQQDAQLTQDIAVAEQQSARLRTLLAEVRTFEGRRAQLQQRVTLIEQLRQGQSVPVQILDHVSRSLPDMLWLTAFDQTGADVTIEGRSNTLIALSDFVGNLGASELLKKPIEIVDSQVETAAAAPGAAAGAPPAELITFTVKAQLASAPAAATTATPGARR